ncbi:CRISPR-associated endoribonuclease Cas6 [Lentimicrobium saccharophilum]|uniref:CRISPR-associated endoribonuclease n=1 Tax=Lentimicrobium saccharophilum TaxID=1678841 RepID=A0A0S7C4M1_9BACT|nr:CRISPR-associated endoribonuclease Cas6 [Lentimicrobium saccharophilum]GAP44192.1 CRISPR-associated endoribonuclease Cas6 [Lentimicrobium saccharophilum]
MRIRLNIRTDEPHGNVIPVNYSYPLSAWIYRTIASGNHEFAGFLHDSGFKTGLKQYKLFCFSQLQFPEKGFKVEGDRLSILKGECRLEISFMAPLALETFIAGLFRGQRFRIGDKLSAAGLRVESVEILPNPGFSGSMKFKCISPILVSKERHDSRNAEYLSPEHNDFQKIFFDNLINKYTAALTHRLIGAMTANSEDDSAMLLKILNTPRSHLITIKAGTPHQTKIKGYTFDFEITAPQPLIYTGYTAGFGEKNALGLGCVKIDGN